MAKCNELSANLIRLVQALKEGDPAGGSTISGSSGDVGMGSGSIDGSEALFRAGRVQRTDNFGYD